MEKFRIVTNHSKLKKDKIHFYVLCKGMNSGKPSETYIQNSFVIFVDDEETKERLFWLTYFLWMSKAIHPFLIGSVIPFIRIREYKQIIETQYQNIIKNLSHFDSAINKLKIIEQTEKRLNENVKQIQVLKRAFIHTLFHS